MIQEEKTKLITALCGYLPYGVLLDINLENPEYKVWRLVGIDLESETVHVESLDKTRCFRGVEIVDFDTHKCIKPYVRSLNNMTDNERDEWITLRTDVERYIVGYDAVTDFYNKHFIDYRQLIDEELALEAPENMYNLNND